jgi:hypothetical protein
VIGLEFGPKGSSDNVGFRHHITRAEVDWRAGAVLDFENQF